MSSTLSIFSGYFEKEEYAVNVKDCETVQNKKVNKNWYYLQCCVTKNLSNVKKNDWYSLIHFVIPVGDVFIKYNFNNL